MKNSTQQWILWLSLFVVLLKVLLIDYDPPKWNIGYYQPLDENYYVFQAQNYFETGDFFGKDPVTVFGSPILTNAVAFATLSVFGDNYLGLRFGSILFALGAVTILWFILLRLSIPVKIMAVAMLFLVISYPFTLASIVVTPTIARICFALLCLLLSIQWLSLKQPKFAFSVLLSALTLFSVVFVYPTNAFLVLALLVIVGIHYFQYQPKLNNFLSKTILPMAIGAFAVFGLYSIFSNSFGENVFDLSRASSYKGRVGLNLRTILLNCFFMFRANSFLMNPLVAIAIVPSLAVILKSYWQDRDIKVVVPAIFFLSFLLQTVFINDFPERKLIFLFPFTLILISQAASIVFKTSKSIQSLIPIIALCCFVVAAMQFLLVYRFHATFYNFSWVVLILSLILLALYSWQKIQLTQLIFILIAASFFLDIAYTVQYSILHQQKHYKQAMNKLSAYDGEQFLGGWSLGFTRYNNIKADVNYYLYYGRIDDFWSKDGFFSLIDSLADSTPEQEYTIWYDDFEEQMKSIGFEPIDTLIKAEDAVYPEDLILYKEVKPTE